MAVGTEGAGTLFPASPTYADDRDMCQVGLEAIFPKQAPPERRHQRDIDGVLRAAPLTRQMLMGRLRGDMVAESPIDGMAVREVSELLEQL